MQASFNTEIAVRDRYSQAAKSREASLCCPVDYDPHYLEAIPKEVLELDYGCGDPSRYLKEGETVLDLGCGAGKICFIASQIVGPSGQVFGVDMTQAMLDVARRNSHIVGSRLGYTNTLFKRGFIQDLSLDLEKLDDFLSENPVTNSQGFVDLSSLIKKLRKEQPLIEDESIDVIVSNCVLNLVDVPDRPSLFSEIYRVLRPGGRAVIADIVSSTPVPETMQKNPELWSGCISGAMTEVSFLSSFERVGFHGMTIAERQARPWQTFENIEFRSITVEAYKPSTSKCSSATRPVIYKGPFKEVVDDSGHSIRRGDHFYVCDKTYSACLQAPYKDHFLFPDRKDSPDKTESCSEETDCC